MPGQTWPAASARAATSHRAAPVVPVTRSSAPAPLRHRQPWRPVPVQQQAEGKGSAETRAGPPGPASVLGGAPGAGSEGRPHLRDKFPGLFGPQFLPTSSAGSGRSPRLRMAVGSRWDPGPPRGPGCRRRAGRRRRGREEPRPRPARSALVAFLSVRKGAVSGRGDRRYREGGGRAGRGRTQRATGGGPRGAAGTTAGTAAGRRVTTENPSGLRLARAAAGTAPCGPPAGSGAAPGPPSPPRAVTGPVRLTGARGWPP